MNNDFLSDSLNAIIAKQRAERFGRSNQLSVGELILLLEPIVAKQKEIVEKYKREAIVGFDFEYAVPTGIDSWRGSYNELAISFDFIGSSKKVKEMPISKFLEMLKGVIGKEFTGYKGGEFIMGKNTPLWVANYGNSGNTAIVGVIDNEYSVILETKYMEY